MSTWIPDHLEVDMSNYLVNGKLQDNEPTAKDVEDACTNPTCALIDHCTGRIVFAMSAELVR